MQTFTITFGDQAENHKGMQKIGELAKSGFSLEDLQKIKSKFFNLGAKTKLFNLNKYVDDSESYETIPEAYLLLVKNGLSHIVNTNDFYYEQDKLTKDTKAFMYGRVVNKKLRHNLCFSDFSQEPDYEKGMGTVYNFKDVPLLNTVREALYKIAGDKAYNLQAEGNYYYNIEKCGIGEHGDTERKIVIGIRVGAKFPLHFRWFHKGKPISPRIKFILENGDIYFMSDKTVGYDWKKSSILTLRHGAGQDNMFDD